MKNPLNKIKGSVGQSLVNIGDKHLTMSNVEDSISIRIFIVDDIYEISLRETGYECRVHKFDFNGDLKNFSNTKN